MEKRGSHVGMVLSFVVFITFLVFLYSAIEPTTKTQKNEQALLDYLKIELTEKLSSNLTSVSIAIDKITSKDCVELENLRTETEIDSKIIVKDNLEKTFTAKISDDDLFIGWENPGNDFFKIRVSEEFEEAEPGPMSDCETLNKESGDYTIGLVRTDKYIFETKAIELKEEYEDDYENLKDELKIPSGSEFGFSFNYNNGTIIRTEEKSVSTNIYTEETPIQYIDRNASILSGFISIKIWE